MWTCLHRAFCTVTTYLCATVDAESRQNSKALHRECMFTYAYADATWLCKATATSRNGKGSSCCSWLQINVCLCVCVWVSAFACVWINVLKSHIYLSDTCDLLSNTPASFIERSWNKFGGEFIPVQTLKPFRRVMQNYDYQTCARVRQCRDGFSASQCSYWFVKMDYAQYVQHD